ncbi:flagellar biosynthesis protein FlhA [Anaeroarcus burkinensis]|uniref:flagellar biosynthesis protein FlhA n=1 Tax=Anaeroarcus burkinensis TaxID=82376 RepID=UPI0004271630|nr:flagellar biosynthesis protein FlhA [Anaeroarcus burkinensis]
MPNQGTILHRILRYSDIIIAVAVVTIVVMMIIPLPTILLDMLLALNISLALTIVMVAIYNEEPLDFSVFPSLLLLATLFRLALNVSATRLILLEGYAGEVIMAFGNFVVGGNAVVGFIVFVILIIIQFIVITKGAERVAEVAARFTLDAMPGKQMSIDADLNSGTINEQEARDRRKKIQREADFYGAMDGASKFVKGDAIAAIVIIIINIVGGFVIGMVQRNLEITQALQQYTLLTVGEGLVNQIPALLISTATGIVVTRAASDSNLGQDFVSQLFTNQRVFFLVSGVLLLLALVPGLPTLPFICLSLATFGVGFILRKTSQSAAVSEISQQEEQEKEEVKKPENIVALLQVDPMELEIGYSLIPMVDASQGGDLLDRIVMIRRQCALEMGLIVPTIRIRDNIQLKPNIYVIKLKGIEVARGELLLDQFLAMNSGTAMETIPGMETVEPAFGLPALWIQEGNREQAELAGYTVVDPISVLTTHLTEVIKSHASEILGRQETQTLVDAVKQSHAAVVEDLVPAMLSVGELQKVLCNLLRERISIRDLVTILETLGDYVAMTKDTEILTEYVRQALSRQISRQYASNGTLVCLAVDQELEQLILAGVQRSEQGSFVALEPQTLQALVNCLGKELPKLTEIGYQPIVLVSPGCRLYFRKLTERVAENLIILSYAELEPNVQIQTLGMVKV